MQIVKNGIAFSQLDSRKVNVHKFNRPSKMRTFFRKLADALPGPQFALFQEEPKTVPFDARLEDGKLRLRFDDGKVMSFDVAGLAWLYKLDEAKQVGEGSQISGTGLVHYIFFPQGILGVVPNEKRTRAKVVFQPSWRYGSDSLIDTKKRINLYTSSGSAFAATSEALIGITPKRQFRYVFNTYPTDVDGGIGKVERVYKIAQAKSSPDPDVRDNCDIVFEAQTENGFLLT